MNFFTLFNPCLLCLHILFYKQWQIQHFPEVGAPTLQGAPTYDYAKFSRKMHEIERIWTPRGSRTTLSPPWICQRLIKKLQVWL